MQPICLHDRAEIAAALLRHPELHLYAIGDLDDFFWPYTTWYAMPGERPPERVLLVYSGTELPVLLGLDRPPLVALHRLLQATLPLLPGRFYAHLTHGAEQVFQEAGRRIVSHGRHLKMTLAGVDLLAGIETTGVEQLSPADLPALQALYAAAYPGNWFDPRMLETGCYYGLSRGAIATARDQAGRAGGDPDELLSVAGVHVYSPRYRVAALGNITTHPSYRGRGLCTSVTARLCQALYTQTDTIGLNVLADNQAAIHCYEKLGFAAQAEYEEFMID